MNLEPGTLCLIISGLSAGEVVTAEYQASETEVAEWLWAKGKGLADTNPSPYWKLNKGIKWKNLLEQEADILVPYSLQKRLLPIPPLDGLASLTNQKELQKC